MEAFSLLKYWRTSATSKSIQTTTTTDCSSSSSTTTTPIITTASPRSSTSSSDNDEGPYFDLEFSLPDQNNTSSPPQKSINTLIEEHQTDSEEEAEEAEGVEREVNLSISSSCSFDSTKEHSHSHENHLFFTPKVRKNLFKSASKLRVLMALKLKKLKENGDEEAKDNRNHNRRLFTVKFIKVEEAQAQPQAPAQAHAPVVSLFRESSSKSETLKGEKGSNERDEEEKRYTKDVMQRYLKMMKPLYVRASKRYGEKMRFSGQLMGKGSTLVVAASEVAAEVEVEGVKDGGEVGGESVGGKSSGRSLKERNLTAGLRVVRKHLGKSKSASAAVTVEAQPGSQRRDDSLIQQQDGIQSAILHCKRSFNSSRESSVLQRSSSHQQATVASSTEEQGV